MLGEGTGARIAYDVHLAVGTRVEDIGNGLFEMFDVISIRCFRILPSLS